MSIFRIWWRDNHEDDRDVDDNDDNDDLLKEREDEDESGSADKGHVKSRAKDNCSLIFRDLDNVNCNNVNCLYSRYFIFEIFTHRAYQTYGAHQTHEAYQIEHKSEQFLLLPNYLSKDKE